MLRIRARWQKYYLAYLGSYAAWLLSSTFALFQRSYLLSPPASVETIFGYARAGVSVVMVIVGPLFYVMVGRQFAVGGRQAPSSGPAEWVVMWVVAAIILALVVLMFVTGSPVYSAIGTSLFNLS